jgi:dTDP-4-dehydrorhamnose reductase
MKVLVLGVSGLAGHAFARAALRRGHEVHGIRRRSAAPEGLAGFRAFDAADADALTRACLDLWPDAIVNAAAISSPAEVEADPAAAEQINVALPRRLAQISTHIGARLLHLSTDMVFDGAGPDPLRSTDVPCPSSLYGQTKLMAEREVLEHNAEDPVVLRVTLLSGNSPGGRRSLHEKLLHALARGERPRLFEDEIRQPLSTSNLAEVLVELCERRDLHGIFHWAGAEALSRYEMGRRILDHLGLPGDLVEPARLAGDPALAGRPADLRFNLHPLVNKLKTRPASFLEMLDEIEVPEELRGWLAEARARS